MKVRYECSVCAAGLELGVGEQWPTCEQCGKEGDATLMHVVNDNGVMLPMTGTYRCRMKRGYDLQRAAEQLRKVDPNSTLSATELGFLERSEELTLGTAVKLALAYECTLDEIAGLGEETTRYESASKYLLEVFRDEEEDLSVRKSVLNILLRLFDSVLEVIEYLRELQEWTSPEDDPDELEMKRAIVSALGVYYGKVE